jgi:hypothetical protein
MTFVYSTIIVYKGKYAEKRIFSMRFTVEKVLKD